MSDEPVVRLLGPITIRPPGGDLVAPARLDRVVLAHLALAEGRAVPVGDLSDALWGSDPPAGARNALQVKVSRLRRRLGPLGAALRYDQGSYRLDLPATAVDLRLLADLTRWAAEALAQGCPADAAATARRALGLWQGPPLTELDDHPRLVAARERATEQRSTLVEVLCAATLEAGSATEPIELLRALLAEQPLRPRARLLLMRALDLADRRAEALAVYDVGRRVLAEQTGLTPPAELQEEFARLLAAERGAARRAQEQPQAHVVPPGAMDTARWLAREGAAGTALELALRGCWWWWLGGRRSEGRDLLEELVGLPATEDAGDADRPAVLGAGAWLAVFDAVSEQAAAAIAEGERALHTALGHGWDRHTALAAVLLAERLLQRGEPRRGAALLAAGQERYRRAGDAWGLALVELTEAKARLQRGDVAQAAEGGRVALRAFEELDEAAGQMMAMDLLGYCAEIVGDLPTAARTHRRALGLAREVGAPEWQATQLTRLGSVQALAGVERGIATLGAAAQLARSIGSPAGVALAENGLGLARGLLGDHDEAADIHATALAWYERQDSAAGMSYTAGRLALELIDSRQDEAVRLALRSVDLARGTGDPRAVAHGLEAVVLTHDHAPTRARALGGARALRRRTGSPLPSVIDASLRAAQDQLAEQLGDDLLPRLREGAREARSGHTPSGVAG